ncbi:putative indole-3-acetic acid-amido synthetase GH3.9 [Tripterygium wilfordii]|uniref:putative indole-3-acetic acid-amido synthetase GH3.9 n=1 Tax=Tripterygium wilfordii TaxID=458696 RepID=UPI0018F7EDAB|nr:putative indole-3-acetic acid-amido synthetase GH3.9 [Tripterygium wilfordii]
MDGKKLEYKGEEALKEIENLTVNPAEVQESILKDILTRNSETEYLSKYLKGSKDVTEFKRHVPVITYKDIYPYIRRIANGEDSSLITGHPIVEMLCSSGTSGGEPKLMPSIAEDLDRRTFLYNLIMPIMNQYISGLDEGKAMQLYFVKAEMSTPCGLPARTVLTSYYKSKHFKCRTHDPFNDYTSPNQAILCNDSYQSMYCQLVSGLVHRQQVLRLGAVFASALLRSISFLERNWAKMCNDIRAGQLDSKITDPECRSCMSIMISSPDPSLADEIEEICSRSSWRGILCHLWPKAKYIEAVVTGSMGQYIPSLEYYSDGKLPLVSPMYASSECYFGVNLKPLCDPADVAFTLMPNMCYYEFLPLGENGTLLMQLDEEEEVPNDRLVDLVHVKVGSYYELVVTTYAGLHRYRIGDVLQVTGFHNRAPQFRFICRRNVVLSIDNDNTNEEDLHKSITVAKKLLDPYNAILVEYTSYADTSSVPGHYVLYWEILHHPPQSNVDSLADEYSKVIEQCCLAVEEELDYTYRRCRAHDKSVGPLEIRVVEPGTFEALMDMFISQGGSINQYKTPRCVKSRVALELLDSHVKASFFSYKDPNWIP